MCDARVRSSLRRFVLPWFFLGEKTNRERVYRSSVNGTLRRAHRRIDACPCVEIMTPRRSVHARSMTCSHGLVRQNVALHRYGLAAPLDIVLAGQLPMTFYRIRNVGGGKALILGILRRVIIDFDLIYIAFHFLAGLAQGRRFAGRRDRATRSCLFASDVLLPAIEGPRFAAATTVEPDQAVCVDPLQRNPLRWAAERKRRSGICSRRSRNEAVASGSGKEYERNTEKQTLGHAFAYTVVSA